MKTLKILMAASLGLGLAASAFAARHPAAKATPTPTPTSKTSEIQPLVSVVTHVYIVGSTAYRGGVTKAIEDILGGPSKCAFAYVAGSHAEYNGGAAIYSGTIQSTAAGNNAVGLVSSGSAVIIKTYWTGSAAGCLDLSSTSSVTGFIPDSAITTSTGGVAVSGTIATESDVPNIAMSDSFATSVADSINGAPTVGSAYAGRITSANLVEASGSSAETVVGIVPFIWVAGAQSTGTVPYTNISQQAASVFCQGGHIPAMALQSGTAAVTDTTDWVFLVGRNEDSGTRICAQAEAQMGVRVSQPSFGQLMHQYYLEFTANTGSVAVDGTFPSDDVDNSNNPLGAIQTGGTNCTVSDAGWWPSDAPVNTEPTINWNLEGHSGQIGGGDVASVLESLNPLFLNLTAIDGGDGTAGIAWDGNNSSTHTHKAYFVGYLGSADAGGIPPSAGCLELSYNGVPYAPENILNGSYTFWSFEHMYYRTDSASNALGAGSLGQNFANDLAEVVYRQDCQTDSSGSTDTNTPPVNVKVGGLYFNSSVKFTRTAEGLTVTPRTF